MGLDCQRDFTNAAILLRQPNHEQPIKWHYAHEEGQPPKEAALTVSRETGQLAFKGGGASFDGSVSVSGLSGDGSQARNLRGKNVPVKEGATRAAVAFAVPEADGDYAVFVEQNWITDRAVVKKEPRGFTVEFKQRAPAGATLDWMIVR